MDNNIERVMLLDSLISTMQKDLIILQLAEKELSYLRFKDVVTEDELKSKLIELLQLANNVRVMENLCLNGLVKL
jgi:hypothetical protein